MNKETKYKAFPSRKTNNTFNGNTKDKTNMLNVNVPKMKYDKHPLTCSLVGALENMGFTDVLVMDSRANVITCSDAGHRKTNFHYSLAVVYASWNKRRLISRTCRKTGESSVGIEFVFHVPNGQKRRHQAIFDPNRRTPTPWNKVKSKFARYVDNRQRQFVRQ